MMNQGSNMSIPDKIIVATNSIEEKSSGEIREQLIFLINELISTDFNALVQLLYKIDVDEEKLKQLLKTFKDTNSSSIIADLIINRQLQKIETKKQFSEPDPDDS